MDKAQLAELFYLDDTSPSGLRWKAPKSRRLRAGDAVGYRVARGYWHTELSGRCYQVHRVIGVLAGLLSDLKDTLHIDHIDGNPSNNAKGNLRAVTNRQNANNRKDHRMGHLVGASPFRGKWMGTVCVGGKQIYLGTFPTEQLAHEAYMTYRQAHSLL